MAEQLYTVQETAKLMKVSAAFVYARIADGSLRHFKIGCIRISESHIQEFLCERERGRKKTPPKESEKTGKMELW